MTNRRSILLLVLIFVFTYPVYLAAQEGGNSGANIRLDLYSRYFYRGFDYNLGKPVFQPNLFYKHDSGFEFNLFTSFGLDKKTEFDEFDISGKYKFDVLEELSLFIGAVGIFFPNTQSIPTSSGKFDYTYELQSGMNYVWGDFSMGLLYAHDFKSADGDCIDINFSYGFDISGTISAIPVMGMVYQTEYGFTGSFSNKFTSLYLFLPVEINFETFTLIPSYNVSYIPSEQMRAVNELYEAGYHKYLHFVGISIKYAF